MMRRARSYANPEDGAIRGPLGRTPRPRWTASACKILAGDPAYTTLCDTVRPRSRGMKMIRLCLLLALLPGLAAGQQGAAAPGVETVDLAGHDLEAARRLFEANLQAIRDKDKDAYLACYLQSDRLVRSGPPGFDLGYAGLA